MDLTSSAIRGCITAPPGKKLVVADLSNIEGRMLAWLAGEAWKLDAFRAFDMQWGVDDAWHTGGDITRLALKRDYFKAARTDKGARITKGHDLYALAYAKAFGISPDAVMENKKHGDGHMRQVGKVMELALGYQGGVGAFLTFAAAYGIDLEAMGAAAIGGLPSDVRAEAESFLAWQLDMGGTQHGLSDTAYVVCESFKRLWRAAHPNVVAYWHALERTCIAAVKQPGVTFDCAKHKIRRDGAWLRIRLPSGRYLCYPSPQVTDSDKLSYMGMNQYTRQWSRLGTYGGKLAENCTQAAARDVLASSMQSIEDAGYEIALTVHDEDITEAPDSPDYNCEHLAALMATPPTWALDLPLAAAGFEAYRYRKD
jgi:DNA polymerase